ncbi:alpha/beta hydrolase [uncultured Tateyamaria sp.]|uniref:alpha/beta fold hydrolase n=1 Tax=uncultured Tateyamaria sp. TaxID=455651 RepID=UPI0026097907|nr:alpha/beta hydrolase [uncultured Tateyamaria sp.]
MTQFTTPDGITIAYEKSGTGPPVLLLHGFPQTRAMWHAIAPVLARDFTVITADLRGYGDSTKPARMEDMSFRAMAADQVALMQALGFEQFHLVGHDRGGRTAHRLALDHADSVLSLTLMDIVPTHLLLDDLSQQVARAYYHWFFLAQPEPIPETLIGYDPDTYFETCLAGWGGRMDGFAEPALNAYRKAWREPDCIRSMCNDYRAAIDVDFALDAQDLERQVDVPTLVLYGADGVMGQAYDVPDTWANRLSNMQSVALPGGHFFPDTHPQETSAALLSFLTELTA